MHIPVTCSQCAAKFKAPQKAAGRQLKCPKCSAAIVVPNVSAPQQGSDPQAGAADPFQVPQPEAASQPEVIADPYLDPLDPAQSPQGYGQPGHPPQGHPPHGYPQQGHPQQGYPPQGYPQQQGYPPQGHPQQPYPPQGYPPQGYPQQAPPPGYGYAPHPGHAPAKPKKPKKKSSPVRLAIIGTIAAGLCLGIYFGTFHFLKGKEMAKIEKKRKSDRSRMTAANRDAVKAAENERKMEARRDKMLAPSREVDNQYDTGKNSIYGRAKGSDDKLELADLIERVNPSIVRLNVESVEGPGTGSGFFLDTEGKIATNFHVVEDAIKITAETADGRTTEVIGFISADPRRDLAIVQIDPSKLKCVPLPIAKKMPRAGEPVAAFGAPQNLSFTTTNGIVSAVRSGEEMRDDLRASTIDVYAQMGFHPDMNWIQTSAAISGGNSGGPLVNMKGEMVGINTWKHAQGENLNFSSAMTEIRKAFENRESKIKSWRMLPAGRGR